MIKRCLNVYDWAVISVGGKDIFLVGTHDNHPIISSKIVSIDFELLRFLDSTGQSYDVQGSDGLNTISAMSLIDLPEWEDITLRILNEQKGK